MKYTILIFSLLFLGLNNSFAQTQFNLKGGFNFTQVNEDYEDGKIDGKAGYQIGMELRIGDRLYVSPGLYYFKSQSRIDFSENTLIEVWQLNV